jgi:hypothetical protein
MMGILFRSWFKAQDEVVGSVSGKVGSMVGGKIREDCKGQIDIHKAILELLGLILAFHADFFKLAHITVGGGIYLLNGFGRKILYSAIKSSTIMG